MAPSDVYSEPNQQEEIDKIMQELEQIQEDIPSKGTPEPGFADGRSEEDEIPIGSGAILNSAASDAGSLSLTLQGKMTLKLKYSQSGQEISLGFSDNCLEVSLSDGTEFKIPMRSPQSSSKKRPPLKSVA